MNKLFALLLTLFIISLNAQTGLPVWPISSGTNAPIQVLDWQNTPSSISTIPAANFADGSTGAAFDGCGRLVFFVIHTGSSNENNLFIYKPNGVELLSNTTPNSPGLNGVRGAQEIQVVRVPESSDEWFIIYSEWNSDTGAPLTNGGYLPSRLLYSRVQYDGVVINVLERDILLNASGEAQTYNDGRAISQTANGVEDAHFLYAARRIVNQNTLSLDRFLINNTGIFFQDNTGEINVGYWNLTHAFSPIEVSRDEETIAVLSRNTEANEPEIVLFSATNFDIASAEILNATEFILVADGTPNDQSAVLNTGGLITNIASDVDLEMQWLQNFHRKISNLEWSPNGQFLYLTGGGFAQGGVTNLTYLAQVDMNTNPREVRLQVQETPNNGYNIMTGIGCGLNITVCSDLWKQINGIQSSFDGKLYFSKSNDTLLYVIPDADSFLPQNLVPSDIDLSTIADQNIMATEKISLLPDQIDGFDYLQAEFAMIDTITIDTFACLNNSIEFMNIQINAGDTSIIGGILNACDTVYQVIVEELPNIETNENITICEGETTLIFGNEENIAGDFVMTFTAENSCDSIHTITLEVLDELVIDLTATATCPGETSGEVLSNISGGLPPYNFSWSNGANSASINNLVVGTYMLTITDANSCEKIETAEVGLTGTSSFTVEMLPVICFGEGNGSLIFHTENEELTFSLDGETFRQDTIYANLLAGEYTAYAQDVNGCIYEESITVEQPNELLISLPQDTILNLGDSLNINPFITSNDSLTYEWTPSIFLDCDSCANPISKPFESVSYTVLVQDTFGCEATDKLRIIVENDHEIFLPNIFSPNEDGINDFIFPFADNAVVQVNYFRIYNRWGMKLFEAQDFQPNTTIGGWDGYFRGKRAENGVYVFAMEVEFVDGVVELFRGDFSLMR